MGTLYEFAVVKKATFNEEKDAVIVAPTACVAKSEEAVKIQAIRLVSSDIDPDTLRVYIRPFK